MKCPYCGSQDTHEYYNAYMPSILSACPEAMLEKVNVLPVEVEVCYNCMLGFNSKKLNDELLNQIYDNYLYISPLHGIGTSKYIDMFELLQSNFSIQDKIVEIGCSEGYLLKLLHEKGYENLTGIEPGPQAETAMKHGVRVIKDYFDENTFENELFDGFYLMHVFEHFENPFRILDLMVKNLRATGKIIIEVPYFFEDQPHHQHLYFYNKLFMKKLTEDRKLKIIYQSVSMKAIRFVIAFENNMSYKEINDIEDPQELIKSVSESCNKFTSIVKKLEVLIKSCSSEKLYWWGAGSLSVIYLNQIDKKLLDEVEIVIVDGDSSKIGCYMPGVNIKVKSFMELKDVEIEKMVIASSFYKEILETMTKHNILVKNIEVIK